jgi:hypothetical protein
LLVDPTCHYIFPNRTAKRKRRPPSQIRFAVLLEPNIGESAMSTGL